jgi:hypothetical protein
MRLIGPPCCAVLSVVLLAAVAMAAEVVINVPSGERGECVARDERESDGI